MGPEFPTIDPAITIQFDAENLFNVSCGPGSFDHHVLWPILGWFEGQTACPGEVLEFQTFIGQAENMRKFLGRQKVSGRIRMRAINLRHGLIQEGLIKAYDKA